MPLLLRLTATTLKILRHRCLPITEECLYIPGIHTGELSTDDSTPRANSLLLVYNRAMHPTHITVNAVKFLVEKVPNLTLLTCECYAVTKFHYYPPGSKCTVSLKMISHGDKNEIRIENDEELRCNWHQGTSHQSLPLRHRKLQEKAPSASKILPRALVCTRLFKQPNGVPLCPCMWSASLRILQKRWHIHQTTGTLEGTIGGCDAPTITSSYSFLKWKNKFYTLILLVGTFKLRN